MTNHVHLVISPGKDSENLSDLMQRLAIRHTMRVNGIHGWSGTLWEGRFRSNPIRSEKYLLACCRYVELNPVRAGIVRKASGYRWSSYRARAGYAAMGWLDEDHCYRNLAQEKHERQRKYRRLTEASVSDDEAKMIRKAIRRGEIMDENAEITLISENAPIYEGLSLM